MIAALAVLATATLPATAQNWPTRRVTMVYPFAAGTGGDILGRTFASRLSELLGQPVIFENVGGAGGMTGASRVAKAAPDGYQFLLGSASTLAVNQTQRGDRLRSGRSDRRDPIHTGRAQGFAGEQSGGVRRLRKSEPGEDALEDALGVWLFERSHRGLKLTNAAARFI
jgi:hypothetical protein